MGQCVRLDARWGWSPASAQATMTRYEQATLHMHELDCRAFEHSLDAYLDGELDPGARVEMEVHLGVCAACKARRGVALAVRQRLQEGCAETKAPEGLKARIWARLECMACPDTGRDDAAADATEDAALQAALNGDGASGPVPMVTAAMVARAQAQDAHNGAEAGWRRWSGWRALSASAVALALVGLSAWGLASGEHEEAAERLEGSVWSASAYGQAEQALLEEGVAWHQRRLPVEVTGPHGEEVARWFGDKLDFHVQMPRFARKDVTLLGGRLAHLKDRRAALLTLAVRQQKVSLLVAPRQVIGRGPQGAAAWAAQAQTQRVMRQVSGYSVAMVQDGDLVYVITADLPARELEQLVRVSFGAEGAELR